MKIEIKDIKSVIGEAFAIKNKISKKKRGQNRIPRDLFNLISDNSWHPHETPVDRNIELVKEDFS